MGDLAMRALRVVLALVLFGTVFVQVVFIPLLAIDLGHADDDIAERRPAALAIMVLGLVTIQVTTVCVWKLLTMVRSGTVFSHAAFRYVDIIIGAMATASLLTFGLAAAVAPGEAVPPGIVVLIGGIGVTVAGIALIVFVMRMLLAQAVARDVEAHHLQAELDKVI